MAVECGLEGKYMTKNDMHYLYSYRIKHTNREVCFFNLMMVVRSCSNTLPNVHLRTSS